MKDKPINCKLDGKALEKLSEQEREELMKCIDNELELELQKANDEIEDEELETISYEEFEKSEDF